MSPLHKVPQLLQQLSQPGGSSPDKLKEIVTTLIEILSSLPSGTDPLRALKQPGVWSDVPLTSADPATAVFFALPTSLDFTNVPPASLKAQLVPQPLAGPQGQAWSQITILAPLKS